MRAVLPLSLALVILTSSSHADQALLARLCGRAHCSGPLARLEVFNDSKGQPTRIRFRGDFRRCSHPPAIYFDMTGKQLASPDDWLRVDKVELADAAHIHREMTLGLRLDKGMACSSICRVNDSESMDGQDCSAPQWLYLAIR
jgi:hypothetical protein